MKKNLLFLMILLLIPISAKAASLEIQCASSSITVGDSVKCTVVGKDTKIGGAGAKAINVTNGTITSVEKGTCDYGDVSATEFTCVVDERPTSVSFVSFIIKSTKVGTMTLTLSDCEFVGNNYKTYTYASITKSVTVKEKATQAPTTKPTTRPTSPTQPTQNTEPVTEPNTEAPVTEPNTEAPVTEPVTEEPTTERLRPTSPKTDSTTELKSLKVKGVELQFNPSNYTYNFTVKNNVQNLEISYEKGNDDQVVVVSNTTLKNGLNTIYVEVTNGNDSTKYTLNATREAGMSTSKIVKIVASSGGLVGLSYALLKILKRH